ncbi:MAG TPA: alpha/beta hydrolase [Nitrospira sp.]|nr:alpha/beta hydrolase [Nitrospira sp.]
MANPRPEELSERRKRLDDLGARYKIASDVRIESVEANGVSAEWSSTPHAEPTCVILFLHGGGYVSGSLTSHRPLTTEIGRVCRARTLALQYRLAPEHPFPAAIEDAVAGYRFLLSCGIEPRHIAVAGDSAGGALTLALMVSARDAGLPQPACGWCISPWTDLECLGASMTSKAAVDPLIQKSYLKELAKAYLNGADPRSALAAPLYANLKGLAPLLIQVGSAETLLDDAVRLASVAGAADLAVTLEIWPDMIHAWPLFHQQLTAGRHAIARAGAFIRSRMSMPF